MTWSAKLAPWPSVADAGSISAQRASDRSDG